MTPQQAFALGWCAASRARRLLSTTDAVAALTRAGGPTDDAFVASFLNGAGAGFAVSESWRVST